jgi:hypothetical protein
MKEKYILSLLVFFLLSSSLFSYEKHFINWEKPRVIVLTDISNEPDDEESMVRFLVYSNEYDVEGLIATTSVWLQNQTRSDLIIKQINAYERIRENLLNHADGFPTPDYLKRITKTGQPEFGMESVGFGKSTPGSNFIIEVVDRPDQRPVWVSIWGGSNTLAQALWDVKYTRSPEDLSKFVSKLRVYSISDQDDAGRWMRITFPYLFYIVTPSSVGHTEYYKATWTGISGDRHYQNGPKHFFELVDNPWLKENIIQNHGPLGELYPPLEYIMEGDTPSFLNLINNGLGSFLNPAYGGWGGRYQLAQTYGETRSIWTNSRDHVQAQDGSWHTTAQATIWRWREAYQYDFAARMDWCIAKKYQDANHNPVAVLNNDKSKNVLEISAKIGDRVELSAEGSTDPDGDKYDIQWYVYREAGTFKGNLKLTETAKSKTSFLVPEVKEKSTIHIILQLRDRGQPNLFSYRRAIVTIES